MAAGQIRLRQATISRLSLSPVGGISRQTATEGLMISPILQVGPVSAARGAIPDPGQAMHWNNSHSPCATGQPGLRDCCLVVSGRGKPDKRDPANRRPRLIVLARIPRKRKPLPDAKTPDASRCINPETALPRNYERASSGTPVP